MTNKTKGTILALAGMVIAIVGSLVFLGCSILDVIDIFRQTAPVTSGQFVDPLIQLVAIVGCWLVGGVAVGIGAAMKKG